VKRPVRHQAHVVERKQTEPLTNSQVAPNVNNQEEKQMKDCEVNLADGFWNAVLTAALNYPYGCFQKSDVLLRK
jgi:hypothetical protein